MKLLFRKSDTHNLIMGRTASRPRDNDYVILDGAALVGRIYLDTIHGGPKWRWFLQTVSATPPNQGMTDSLDEAKTAFKQRYGDVKQSRK
jgi:hypothetical protein